MKDRYSNCSVNEKYVLEYIRQTILGSDLQLKDYQYEGAPQSLYFYKHIQNSNIFLSIGYKRLYPDEIFTAGFNTNVSIIEVESILNNLTEKHLNPVFDITKKFSSTISFNKHTVTDFDEVWGSFKKYRDVDLVTNPDVLDALCNHYIEVIGKHFIPFWEKYSDLQYINDEIIDKVDQMQLSKYFGAGLVQFKKLIIMKLCNNKNYHNYLDWLLNIYITKEEIMKNDEAWQAKYNLFKELIQILENKKLINQNKY